MKENSNRIMCWIEKHPILFTCIAVGVVEVIGIAIGTRPKVIKHKYYIIS